ncbi:MAG: ribonuclease activity regulator RraA [Chloroflexi bacterium]|nr:ribonuclease activity regulator RraA [Chloroflexota bacterium]
MLIEGLEPLPAGVLEKLGQASTASVTSELFKLGIRHSFMTGVAPLSQGQKMIGEAVTLRYLPYREDLVQWVGNRSHPQRKTINEMGPGEVLVIDARGSLRAGTLGEILMARIKAVGGAGMVTDGAVRDAEGIRGVGIPVFVGGIHASASNTVHYVADANLPIQCGGVTVMPGDIILGDSDGVVVIPRAMAAKIADESVHHDELEVYLYERITGGDELFGVYPPSEETLRDYEAWKKQR